MSRPSLRESLRDFLLDRRYGRTRFEAPQWLPHWHWRPPGDSTLAALHHRAEAIARRPAPRLESPLRSGDSDVHAIGSAFAGEVVRRLQTGDARGALQVAQRLVAIDLTDSGAFALWLQLFGHLNAEALAAVGRVLTGSVVLHISCRPRIDRAEASCASFRAAAPSGVSQLIVVGSGNPEDDVFHFDAASGVLTVPASDAYEHLPAKVVAAAMFMALVPKVEAVLKVDDDHRLHSATELPIAFGAVRSPMALQRGLLTRIPAIGLHPRAWHFGKSADPETGRRPFTRLGTTRWINGSSGYFLNRPALRLLFWSRTYFGDFVTTALYEDMAVSELIERLGGRLIDCPMDKVVGSVDA